MLSRLTRTNVTVVLWLCTAARKTGTKDRLLQSRSFEDPDFDAEALLAQASRVRDLAARCPSPAVAAVLLDYARDRELAAWGMAAGDTRH